MVFQEVVTAAQTYFPDFQVKYKEDIWWMRILGKILFFNKEFMTYYSTTIGSTVYFPKVMVEKLPTTSAIVLLHELVHIHDSKRLTKPFFSFLYLLPQVLSVLSIPFFFLFGWKIALLPLLFLAPLPAYFRMTFEKRAYISSLYVLKKLSLRWNKDLELDTTAKSYAQHFIDSSYYFMWPFSSTINQQFNEAVVEINKGNHPYEDSVFDTLDDLQTKI